MILKKDQKNLKLIQDNMNEIGYEVIIDKGDYKG